MWRLRTRMKFSKEEINEIVNQNCKKEDQVDIFNLYVVIILGNRNTTLTFRSDNIATEYEDFEWCETEEQVIEQFHDSIKDAIKEQLLK